MPARLLTVFDPMVRLLLLAILLASVLPVTGEGRGIAQGVSNAAVFLLFFLNGLRLPRSEVLSGLGNLRMLLPLALWCFGGMALAGWGLSLAGAAILPPLVALGFLYLGILPSTVQSATAYCSLAHGNVAASVVAAALLNILGVFVSAPLFAVLAGSAGPGLDLAALGKIGLTLLLPFALGQQLQGVAGRFVRENRRLVTWLDRFAIATAVYVAFSGAVEQGVWGRIDVPAWAGLLGLVGIFLAIGFAGAWLLGGLLSLQRGDRIATLFSGGQKSIAMGAPLAVVLFPAEQAGLVLLPLITYHLLQMVVSAPLASRLARGG